MRTDKQLYLIFEANPQWLLELLGLPSPGPCQFDSVSLKAIEQTADGVVIPDVPDEIVTIVEIQFQRDEDIYSRVVIEMALEQRKMRGRRVRGVVLFADLRLDPQTDPWIGSSRLLRCRKPFRGLRLTILRIRWSPFSGRCWKKIYKNSNARLPIATMTSRRE